MMKICLINPPVYKEVKDVYPPLGLAYIDSYLDKFGYDCQIIDAHAFKKDIGTIVKEVVGRFELVLITTVTLTMHTIIKLAHELKIRDPNIKIILEGVHATVAYNTLLKCRDVDIAVIGEGEITTLELIKAYEKDNQLFKTTEKLKNIDGIAFFEPKTKKIIKTKNRQLIENLDIIPFPRYDKLPMHMYKPAGTKYIGMPKGKTAFMVTARGCPNKCTFCASQTIWPRFRFRSAGNIINEIKLLIKKYGIRQIIFLDDTFTAIQRRLEEICDFLMNKNIKWNSFSRVSDIKDKRLLRKMYESGCFQLDFGIESGNQHILDNCKKNIKVDDILRATRLCNEVGIGILGYFVFGLPGETRKTAMETIGFINRLNLDFFACYICLPFPGTPIYYRLVKEAKIKKDHFENFTKDYSLFNYPIISVCDLSVEELKNYRSYAITHFYFSRNFILKTIKKILKSPRSIYPFVQMFREFNYFNPEVLKSIIKN